MAGQWRSDFWFLAVEGDGFDYNSLGYPEPLPHYCCYPGGSPTMTVYVRRPGGEGLYPIGLTDVIIAEYPNEFSVIVFERLRREHGYELRGDPAGMSVEVISRKDGVLFRCLRQNNDRNRPFVIPTELKDFY